MGGTSESAASPDEPSSQEWAQAYSEQWRLYDAFSTRIQSLLEELLKAAGIVAVQVDGRAKDVESFAEKLDRKTGKYNDPLRDMTDLAGARVIVYYASDVERVGALIEQEFIVDTTNSWKRTPSSDPDRFGYRSDHYVVSCSDSRSELGEWSPYGDLKVEIQVRTVLQHAWAAIDHRLNYKRSSEIPAELKRQLFRISALLEVADDQFESVRVAASNLTISYERSVAAGELTLPVDRASIEIYVDRTPQTKYWADLAADVGFRMEPGPEPADSRQRGIGALTLASQASHFIDLSELDRFLLNARTWGKQALKAMYSASEHGMWYMSPGFVMSAVVLMGSDMDKDELAATTEGSGFYVGALMDGRAAIGGAA